MRSTGLFIFFVGSKQTPRWKWLQRAWILILCSLSHFQPAITASSGFPDTEFKSRCALKRRTYLTVPPIPTNVWQEVGKTERSLRKHQRQLLNDAALVGNQTRHVSVPLRRNTSQDWIWYVQICQKLRHCSGYKHSFHQSREETDPQVFFVMKRLSRKSLKYSKIGKQFRGEA